MKQEIYDYICQITSKYPDTSLEKFSAQSISAHMRLNRSTVSSYLNQGCREGKLVKIKQYPVLFFSKKVLSDLGIQASQEEYDTLDELFVSPQKNTSVLDNIIGANRSLREAIDQIKTAVLYPDKGLPVLLIGSSGSGKTFLASKVYEFAKEEKVIPGDAPFISYNCAQYYSNPELLSSLLFGHTKGAFTGADETKAGLFEKADGGVLFLDEVHRLSEEGQEKLFTFMDTGEFSPVGDNSIKYRSNVRLVFATTENIYSSFLPTFLRRIPVIVSLPKFQNRPQVERLQLIDSFFIRESNILNREVQVSDKLLEFLINADLEGNVGKIKNIIKYACGNAYVHQKDQEIISVRLLDIPKEYIEKIQMVRFKNLREDSEKRRYLPHEETQVYLTTREEQLMTNFYKLLYVDFKKVRKRELDSKDFIERSQKNAVILMDEFMFNGSYEKQDNLYSMLTHQVRQTFEYMSDTHGFNHDGNLIVALANYLYVNSNKTLPKEELSEYTLQEELNEYFSDILGTSYWYSKQLLTKLSQQLDQEVELNNVIFIALYFQSLEFSNIKTEIKGLVLAHGYSTASSLANVANRMLKKNVFQAYDMPIDITLDQIEKLLISYLNDNLLETGLVLLVDMGSLNQLGKRLEKRLTCPLLIIDHVSTPLVLEVGQLILQEQSLQKIDMAIEENLHIQKQLILPQLEKTKAILTCCYTGIGSAIQIQEILQECLRQSASECMIIPYDYKKLVQNKTYETPFQMYDVLMIVGTENPQIPNIPYIGLDQLINGEKIEEFITILQQYFTINEKDIHNEVLFNFSISKIVQNLTILDGTKLLRFVQKAIDSVQSLMDMELNNSQLFLLYLHCSCMVERILRKEGIDEQVDIEEYIQNFGHELELIHRAFSNLENEYKIEIPIYELRLIHEIILGE